MLIVTLIVLASTDPTTTIALIAAIGGPLVAYLAAARQFSGKVATSDATDLWKESAAIRKEYRDRIAELMAEVAGLRGEVAHLRGELEAARRKVAELEGRNG